VLDAKERFDRIVSALGTPFYSDGKRAIYQCDCRHVVPSIDADVLVTDPPYGMALRSGMGGQHGECKIAGDDDTSARDEVLQEWGDRPAIVFGRWSVPRPVGTRMVLVWEKGEHVGMGDLSLPWKPNTEEIYVLGKGFSGRRDGSVIRHLAVAGCVGRNNEGYRHHPTEKPVGLMKDLLRKCPEGIILDPFMGSGTTLRAAKDLDRYAIGIELELKYCEVAAKRLRQSVLAFDAAEA
jgi:site-specific DNA-methyltransferase (adenine-specific)